MDYDAELRLLNQALRLAYGIERHDREISAGGLRVAVPPHLDSTRVTMRRPPSSSR
jgi:hypothetical protein